MLSRRARIIGQWIFLAVCLFVLVFIGDFSEFLRLPVIHWPFVFLVFLSTLGITLVHNLRWTSIVREISTGSPRTKINFFIYYQWLLNSYVVGTLIPSDISLAGVRTYYMERSKNLMLPVALFSVLLDRFFDFVVFIIFVFPSILFITKMVNGIEALFILGGVIALTFFFVRWKKGETIQYLMKLYQSGINTLLRLPILQRLGKAMTMESPQESSFSETSLCQLMGWSYLKYLFLSLRFYFIGQAFGVNFSVLQGIFFIPFIQLVGMLNITPGGLGVIEMGSYGALLLMGVPESKIMLFVVAQRALITIFTIGLALMSYFIFSAFSMDLKLRGTKAP